MQVALGNLGTSKWAVVNTSWSSSSSLSASLQWEPVCASCRLGCKRQGQYFALKSLDVFTPLFSLLVFILKGFRNTSAIYTDPVLSLTWTRGGEDYVKKANVV